MAPHSQLARFAASVPRNPASIEAWVSCTSNGGGQRHDVWMMCGEVFLVCELYGDVAVEAGCFTGVMVCWVCPARSAELVV